MREIWGCRHMVEVRHGELIGNISLYIHMYPLLSLQACILMEFPATRRRASNLKALQEMYVPSSLAQLKHVTQLLRHV